MSNPALGQGPGQAPGQASGRPVPESSHRGDIDLIFKLKESQTQVDPLLQTTLVELTVEYDKMILVFFGSYLVNRPKSIRDLDAAANFFTTLAGIVRLIFFYLLLYHIFFYFLFCFTKSVFCALAQLLLIMIAFTLNANHILTSAKLDILRTFTFLAVGLDFLGMISAILYVQTLMRVVSKGNVIVGDKSRVCQLIWNMLDVMKNGQGSSGANQEQLQNLIKSCQGIHEDLRRLAHIIMEHSNSNWGILTAVFSGIFLFSATLSALITLTQRSAAWIPTMVILGVGAAVLALQELHRHPGIRRNFCAV